eukprot:TRINITY_DN9874_c0_g1_i4.p1 TRINITY_DN9874_c0_g1~~TRINITY_DN9874_c0_g1_i4.p1  ORF type:complete len:212 (+),score=25.51 TRINITY_DN9874_c0_g1_i4:95-730(+)
MLLYSSGSVFVRNPTLVRSFQLYTRPFALQFTTRPSRTPVFRTTELIVPTLFLTSPVFQKRTYKAFKGQRNDLLQTIERLTNQRMLRRDEKQMEAAHKLNDLANQLIDYTIPKPEKEVRKSTWLNSFLGPSNEEKPLDSYPVKPRGLYIFGDVGTGKTMLMDLFAESVTHSQRRNRVHFNSFMLSVHQNTYRPKSTRYERERTGKCNRSDC